MKGVRRPQEHNAQSTSPSFSMTSSQSSYVCQPRLCLQTPFLGLLLSQGPSPGVCSARLCLPHPCPSRGCAWLQGSIPTVLLMVGLPPS